MAIGTIPSAQKHSSRSNHSRTGLKGVSLASIRRTSYRLSSRITAMKSSRRGFLHLAAAAVDAKASVYQILAKSLEPSHPMDVFALPRNFNRPLSSPPLRRGRPQPQGWSPPGPEPTQGRPHRREPQRANRLSLCCDNATGSQLSNFGDRDSKRPSAASNGGHQALPGCAHTTTGLPPRKNGAANRATPLTAMTTL